MAKSRKSKDSQESARRKMARAQDALQAAQEKRARVVLRAEGRIEDVRRREAARVEAATEAVDRRAAKLARVEARLIAGGVVPGPGTLSAPQSAASSSAPHASLTDDEGADQLVLQQGDSLNGQSSEPLIVAGTLSEEPITDIADSVPDELGLYARRLLVTLRDRFPQTGATYSDWLSAADMAKRTFLSARTQLVESGAVLRDGDGQGAHYRLSPAGQQVLNAASM